MNGREFSAEATDEYRKLIALMFEKNTSVEQYRAAMFELGQGLAALVSDRLPLSSSKLDVCLACTVEDADFLANGLLDSLEKSRPDLSLKLACFWNRESIDPQGFEDCDIAPVIKTYKEEPLAKDCVIVIVKSIISGACVVATNITHLVSDLDPTKIFVVTPIMLTDSADRLRKHFSEELMKRFTFISFATETETDRSISVYQHYGWKDSSDKNKITPEIVRMRRKKLALV